MEQLHIVFFWFFKSIIHIRMLVPTLNLASGMFKKIKIRNEQKKIRITPSSCNMNRNLANIISLTDLFVHIKKKKKKEHEIFRH